MNKRIVKDIVIFLALLGLSGIVLIPDDGRGVILFGVAIIMLAVALAHAVRKLIFPYIDVKELAEKAKESSISAAMVILGLMYLLATIIQSLVALLK